MKNTIVQIPQIRVRLWAWVLLRWLEWKQQLLLDLKVPLVPLCPRCYFFLTKIVVEMRIFYHNWKWFKYFLWSLRGHLCQSPKPPIFPVHNTLYHSPGKILPERYPSEIRPQIRAKVLPERYPEGFNKKKYNPKATRESLKEKIITKKN